MAVALVVMVGLALAVSMVPLSPWTVEQLYSTGIYPGLQRALTGLTNATPFAMLDLLLVLGVVIMPTRVVLAVRRSLRMRSFAPVRRAAGWLVLAAAAVYVVFVALWGLNYRRLPMESRIALASEAPQRQDVLQLGMAAVRALNGLYHDAHQEGWLANEWRDDTMRAAFREVQLSLSDALPATPGRLKQSVLGMYFRWSGVDGMINPFGLEVLANPDLLPFERPFVAAHEWAHLAGYADESEASFVGWLTCLRASPASQYSGWLYLYWQIVAEVGQDDRAQLDEALTSGVRRDLNAIVERLRTGQLPMLRSASWLLYDQYLRANQVDEGVRSYGLVVSLIARATFDGERLPVRAPAAPLP